MLKLVSFNEELKVFQYTVTVPNSTQVSFNEELKVDTVYNHLSY